MRLIAASLVISLAALAAPDKACDLAKVEDGLWCGKCRKVLVKTEKTTDLDKDNNCKDCKSAPEKVRVCLKDWVPVCGMHEQKPHDKPCCKSKQCCKIETVHSLVTFKCAGCDATAQAEDKIRHAEKVHEQKIEKVCAKSGTYPHGGELPQ